MTYRYADGLKQAASAADEFTKQPESERPEIFNKFVQGLKVAAGSSHQLAHYQENPNWLTIRDCLEKVIEVGSALPTYGEQTFPQWFRIKELLDGMRDKGLKLAISKAMPRYEVLSRLNQRKERLATNSFNE